MNRRQSGGFGKFGLGDRQADRITGMMWVLPDEQFAQKMGNAFERGSDTDIDEPLALDVRRDHVGPVQGALEIGTLFEKVGQAVAVERGNPDEFERRQRVAETHARE
ncbi:hypothetical protein [Sphingopyxis fribergensis]